MNKIYWGYPLEKLSYQLRCAMYYGTPDLAYLLARNLMHAFNRVNSKYWE